MTTGRVLQEQRDALSCLLEVQTMLVAAEVEPHVTSDRSIKRPGAAALVALGASV